MTLGKKPGVHGMAEISNQTKAKLLYIRLRRFLLDTYIEQNR